MSIESMIENPSGFSLNNLRKNIMRRNVKLTRASFVLICDKPLKRMKQLFIYRQNETKASFVEDNII